MRQVNEQWQHWRRAEATEWKPDRVQRPCPGPSGGARAQLLCNTTARVAIQKIKICRKACINTCNFLSVVVVASIPYKRVRTIAINQAQATHHPPQMLQMTQKTGFEFGGLVVRLHHPPATSVHLLRRTKKENGAAHISSNLSGSIFFSFSKNMTICQGRVKFRRGAKKPNSSEQIRTDDIPMCKHSTL